MEIEVKEEQTPSIARVIIADEWNGNPKKAKELLKTICEKWPKDRKVKFLITCGGFIQFRWPQSISRENIGKNLNPKKQAIKILVREAEKCARFVLAGLNKKLKLRDLTTYITLGIDSYKGNINQPHIELVFLKDLRRGKFYWTGKSYPTSEQQNGLVRIATLETHFIEIDEGKVMILVCHDLNIFNPRGTAVAKGWRKRVNTKFKELAQNEKPIYVLHHPHTTVKERTWLNAWKCLRYMLPSVEVYAGAGRFYEHGSKYDPLEDVLKSTKCGDVISFIVTDTGDAQLHLTADKRFRYTSPKLPSGTSFIRGKLSKITRSPKR